MADTIHHRYDTADRFPGYWMQERTGVLRPAIEAFLHDQPMTQEQIAAMRAYLRQWINAPVWLSQTVPFLRAAIDDLTSENAIRAWLFIANDEGIDPL